MVSEKTTNNAEESIEEVEHPLDLVNMSFRIRLVFILLGLLCVNILQYVFGIDFPADINILWVIWLLTIAGYSLIFNGRTISGGNKYDNLHLSYYFPAAVYITLLVHRLGGVVWLGPILYVPDIFLANVLMTRWRGITATAAICACYFVLSALTVGKVVPCDLSIPGAIGITVAKDFLRPNSILWGIFFIGIAYGTGVISNMRSNWEKRLIDSIKRYALKSGMLTKTEEALQGKIKENEYLRTAAKEFIAKKEYELNLAKKDLEENIVNLRKNQRTMFFMIEDLNEMSGQLKEARDHLEEKVRERTNELMTISSKLHRSERLAFLGNLAGSVTHEIRNPLAVLKNALYFLEKQLKIKKNDPLYDSLKVIDKSASEINSIIDDIMGFAKISGPELKDVEAKALLDEALSKVSIPDLIRLETKIDEVPPLFIDKDQVLHALTNIINNAIIAMNGNGKLTVNISKVGNATCMEVMDSGPGIPRSDMDLIFEPLYSTRPKGVGFGLSIAKMMVENHGGRIKVESEAGKGAAFKLIFPDIRPKGKEENG